jgi:DNA-3-methyladenine glycosylase II
MKPDFWDQACQDLSRRDPVMGRIIAERGPVHLVSRGDPFQTLARSIVGQQISVKAAQSVWNRFEAAAGEVAPLRVSRMRVATLRNCGLSERKAEYLKDLARRFHSGEVDPTHWPSHDDEAIIDELVAVRGVGRWTAEMFLIFNLLRPDVLPVDDLGLLRGIEKHYRNGESVSRREAQQLGEAWRPWRTVATWYMWRSLEPVPVEY